MDEQTVRIPRRVFNRVEKPSRYTGGEWNMIRKPAPANEALALRFAFCFPDLYEIGMSNQALRILYDLLNQDPDTICERFFLPAADMREQMAKEGLALFSLESRRRLAAFDMVGFTLQYELSYPSVLEMLRLGEIPLFQKDRSEKDPFVVAGGPVVYNCEPVAPFFDLLMIGEGEELITELMDALRSWKASRAPRAAFLEAAAAIPGVYVPSFYKAHYDAAGLFQRLEALHPAAPERIDKRIIKDLNTAPVPLRFLVPNMEIVHDRVFLELYRGCASGCRFCQAGMIYRPVRERGHELLADYAKQMLEDSGYSEIGLLSLSTGDYSELLPLTEALLAYCEKERVNLSLPSLRLDSVSMDLLERVSRTRKTGLTFAPEAGSQRLRDVINKNIQETDLLRVAREAFARGWNRIKLYFMLGLPEEKDADILEIASLCEKLLDAYFDSTRGQRRPKPKITVSTSFFVPKPWTPYQWFPQISEAEMARRQRLLADALQSRYISYQWHGFQSSVMEAVLSRGDRRLAPVLAKVHARGGWLESWREGFSMERWEEALQDEGLDAAMYASRERSPEEVLPWEHLQPKLRERFLRLEAKKSSEAATSQACDEACGSCGAQQWQAGICLVHRKGAEHA